MNVFLHKNKLIKTHVCYYRSEINLFTYMNVATHDAPSVVVVVVAVVVAVVAAAAFASYFFLFEFLVHLCLSCLSCLSC